MEAEGTAWDENPAQYGHLSMQVDFTVSAKMHCQFPVYVSRDRGPYDGGQLCATVLRAKRNKSTEGRNSFYRAQCSLSSHLHAISGGSVPSSSESRLRSPTPLQKLSTVMFQSHSLKNTFSNEASDWGFKHSSHLLNALTPTQSQCCLLKWVICPQIFKGS